MQLLKLIFLRLLGGLFWSIPVYIITTLISLALAIGVLAVLSIPLSILGLDLLLAEVNFIPYLFFLVLFLVEPFALAVMFRFASKKTVDKVLNTLPNLKFRLIVLTGFKILLFFLAYIFLFSNRPDLLGLITSNFLYFIVLFIILNGRFNLKEYANELEIQALIKAYEEEKEIIEHYGNLIHLARNFPKSDYEGNYKYIEDKISGYSISSNSENYHTIQKLKQQYLAIKPTEAERQLVLDRIADAETLAKAEAECIQKVQMTTAKINKINKVITLVSNADYLSPKERKTNLVQLAKSKELYTSYAEKYASTYFRLHLAPIKEELNLLCTDVYTHKKEIDGNKLRRLQVDFREIISHQFSKFTKGHNNEVEELNRLFDELIRLDKREELKDQISEVLPVNDLKITQGKALEEALERADLQSVETIDFILTELKTNNSIFEKELARLEAENDVMKQFGE